MCLPSPTSPPPLSRYLCGLVACLVGALLLAKPAIAQETDTLVVRPEAPPSTRSPAAPADDALTAPVQFSASDSLVIQFRDEAGGGDLGSLFGTAQVSYEEAQLEAHTIDILFSLDELRARGLPSDTGLVGRPSFNQGSETFLGDELAFNLRTERGRVVGAQTQFDDGFVRAGVAKITEDSTLYIREGVYTTCECVEDPSYSLRASKMKVVDQTWIYTGPIQLYIFNIPMPLWLPFGFLPAQEGRRSGPLPPTYGEDEFGFYLRDFGWYFAMNDYMDLQLQGGFWTKGSWQTSGLYRYRVRDGYDGQLQLSYGRFRQGESGDPGFSVRRTSALRWNHNQTLNPSSSFGADVNLSSTGYLRAVSERYDDRVRQTIQSSVNYRKNWRNVGRSFQINLSQQQNLATGSASLTLPSASFAQNSRKPFLIEDRAPGQQERWFERITYSYSGRLTNTYSFNPLSDTTGIAWYDALFSPSDYREATGDDVPFEFRATHRVPVSANFSVNRVPLLGLIRLNVAPNLSYTEDWFIRSERRILNEETNTFEREQVPGFVALRQFNTGVSVNTTAYGLFPVSAGPYEGLRHTLRPSLSFNYQPDFFDEVWGFSRTVVDTAGIEQSYAIVPGVRRGRQQALSLSLTNVFETKRVRVDSTGERSEDALRLLNLDASTSYNFAADSLRLSNINLSARTTLLGEVPITARASFTPYRINENGVAINRFDFSLTNVSVSARTSLRSDQRGASRAVTASRARYGASSTPQAGSFAPNQGTAAGFGPAQPDVVADFAIPWSLNLDFSYSLTRAATQTTWQATVNTSLDFNLTPNWKVEARTGFDFQRGELATTRLALFRDFSCWQMSFDWVPFGTFQSWSFDLHVKSGKLRDLLRIRQPRSDVRDRFGQLL